MTEIREKMELELKSKMEGEMNSGIPIIDIVIKDYVYVRHIFFYNFLFELNINSHTTYWNRKYEDARNGEQEMG